VRDIRPPKGLNVLSLIGKDLTSLEGLGVQDFHVLYLQRNHLDSLEFFESQPNLKELHLEENDVSTFRGLKIQPKIEAIFIKGNPIAKHPLCHHMCLIAFGNSLKSVDGSIITQIERWQVQGAGEMMSTALQEGWLPSEDLQLPLLESNKHSLALSIFSFRHHSTEQFKKKIPSLTFPDATSTPYKQPPRPPQLLSRPRILNVHAHSHRPKPYHTIIPLLPLPLPVSPSLALPSPGNVPDEESTQKETTVSITSTDTSEYHGPEIEDENQNDWDGSDSM